MTTEQDNVAAEGRNNNCDSLEGMKFRDAMDEIASIASVLDSKDCELEDMVAYHKRSIALINFCKEKLANAKLEIENVSASDAKSARADKAGKKKRSKES